MGKKNILLLTTAFLFLILMVIFGLSHDRTKIAMQPTDFAKKKTKIQFISSWAAYDTKSQHLQKLLEDFQMQHPEIEIVDKSMAGEDFLFILKTDFASGNAPYVFGLWPGSDFRLLVQKGQVADLTDLLHENPQWFHQFKEDTWDYVTVDERIYGVPLELIYEGLFINKDLFEQYHVKVPSNFEDLLQAVKTFKQHGIIPIAYNATPEGSYIYQNIVMKLGGKSEVENPFDDEGNIKTCYTQGMYYMKQLYEAGAFPERALFIDDKTRNDLFLQKKAAMIVQGSWFIGDTALSSYDTTVDIVPFPSIEGGKAEPSAIIYGCGNGIFHISQKAWDNEEVRETSIELLKHLTSKEASDTFMEGSGFISNHKETTKMEKKASLSQKGDELMGNAKEFVGPVDSFIDRRIWEDTIIAQFPRMLRGELSPEEVYEQVREQMKVKWMQQGE